MVQALRVLAEAKRERADTLTEVQDMIEEEKNTILIQVKQPFFHFPSRHLLLLIFCQLHAFSLSSDRWRAEKRKLARRSQQSSARVKKLGMLVATNWWDQQLVSSNRDQLVATNWWDQQVASNLDQSAQLTLKKGAILRLPFDRHQYV